MTNSIEIVNIKVQTVNLYPAKLGIILAAMEIDTEQKKLECVQYRPENSEQWEDFVFNKAKNGTLLHSRAFLAHNRKNEIDDHSLIFTTGSEWIGCLPATASVDSHVLHLHSHPRLTYGGIVVRQGIRIKEVESIVESLDSYCRENSIGKVTLRLPIAAFERSNSNEIEHILWLRGYSLTHSRMEHVLHFTPDPQELLSSYRPKTRNQTRKALTHELRFAESGDFATFWQILEANLQARHGTKPVHTASEICHLQELVGSTALMLFVVMYRDELIAGSVVFRPTPKTLHLQYIASKSDYNNLYPNNFLVHQLAVWGAENGATLLNLGTAQEPDGVGLNRSLLHFKEGFSTSVYLRQVREKCFE